MIGKIATLLGDNNINIAELQVARDIKLKTQLMVLKSDQKTPDEIFNIIKQIKDIYLIIYHDFNGEIH